MQSKIPASQLPPILPEVCGETLQNQTGQRIDTIDSDHQSLGSKAHDAIRQATFAELSDSVRIRYMEVVMRATDVMTQNVISIEPGATIVQAARLMLQNDISGLPVIDDSGRLVGVVTEGDFLRRVETGTSRRRSRWLEYLFGSGRIADEYAHSHGRKVREVMSPEPRTITEDTSLEEIVRMMERYRVKRLPVMRGKLVVGMVSRANLVHALVSLSRDAEPPAGGDTAIRAAIYDELKKQSWVYVALLDIVVRNGIVELFGSVTDDRQRQALIVVAENVPGVKEVRDHLAWVDALGTVAYEPDEQTDRPTS